MPATATEAARILAEELTRFEHARTLAPDSGLQLDAAELDRWSEDRLDELTAALTPFGADRPPALRHTRSMREAAEIFHAEWTRTGVGARIDAATRLAERQLVRAAVPRESPASRAAVPPLWFEPLARAAGAATDAIDRIFPRELPQTRPYVALRPWPAGQASSAASDALVRAGIRAPKERWTRGSELSTVRVTHRPLSCAVEAHVRWRVAFDDVSSPWAPLLAMWERGAWLVALPDALLLYLPVQHAGRVVSDPSKPRAAPPVVYLAGARGRAVRSLFELCGLEALPTGLTVDQFVMRGPLPPPDLPLRED